MRRRDFIKAIGGATASSVSWPLAARAQQPSMPVVGFLGIASPAPSAHGPFATALRQGLNDAGFVERRNIAFEYRWAEGNAEQLPALAADLVRRRVAAIATVGADIVVIAAKNATKTIPIVFTSGGDAVRLGLVDSHSRPGGNVTGVSVITSGLVTKRLELLRDLLPAATTIGYLVNPANPNAEIETAETEAAARGIGRRIVRADATIDSEFDAAVASLARRGAGAALVNPDGYFTGRREQLVAAMARHSLPAIYHFREFAAAGGLISYGANFVDAFRLSGGIIGRILKGAKPGDLPVQQPTKFELVINLKTAKALGIDVPPMLLARADEAIE